LQALEAKEQEPMRPVKKSKVKSARVHEIEELFDPKAARKWERDWQNELIDLEDTAKERYDYAREIYLLQDANTRKAIDTMVETMTRMAGKPVFKFRGKAITADESRLQVVQGHSLNWFAIRIFIACAEFDIQIANFKLPSGKCARCLKPTKRSK
jgi:hypothetical protein